MDNHDDHNPLPGGSGTDDDTAVTGDLNRALAEAIMQGVTLTEAAPHPPIGERRTEVGDSLDWRRPEMTARSGRTVLGIDYAPSQLTLVELAVGKGSSELAGLTTKKCDGATTACDLKELLTAHQYPEGIDVHLSITSPRAVVRHFALPKLPKKRREAAARWEARKLIPFPLSEESAYYGFDFVPDGQGSCRVTLVAVPREDAADVLGVIQALRWEVRSVSVAGTKIAELQDGQRQDPQPAPIAVLYWSPHRSTFVVFKDNELLFHYDLGQMPLPEAPPGQAIAPDLLQKWVRSLGKAVSDAFEFYGGASPDNAVGRLDIFGIPDAVAPLMTDWSEQLSIPIQIKDPLRKHRNTLPPDVNRWLDRNSAEILAAYVAASGRATVDLSPHPLRQRNRARHLGSVARSVFASSMAVLVAWAGLLWTQRTLTERAGARLGMELSQVEGSPIHAKIQDCLTRTQVASRLSDVFNKSGIRWTPALKTIIASIPANARLLSLTAASNAGNARLAGFSIRLEGIIQPSARSHSLILADWLHDLQEYFGTANVTLESTRTIEWKDNRKTAFVLSISAAAPAPGGQS